MFTFTDYYNNQVKLSFEDHPFSKEPKHVWVICRYKNKWLLTNHKERGLEFPGGKVEEGETAEQAAIREVEEETGGLVNHIRYIGQYFVDGKRQAVVKNVYYAIVDTLEVKDTYHETNGPHLLKKIPKNVKNLGVYSFLMKDNVLKYSLRFIDENDL
ncbi:RNA deprotection pyrophosphohydrolase [Virgibacillus kimchii]